MLLIAFYRQWHSTIRRLFEFCLVIIFPILLAACSVNLPSIGLGKRPAATASLPGKRSYSGVVGAAYDRRPARLPDYRPESSRSSYDRQPRENWIWSQKGRRSRIITVRSGQSLYGIASQRRVAISELMAANRLPGPNIVPGQRLVVPMMDWEQAGTNRYDRQGSVDHSRAFTYAQASGTRTDSAGSRLFERSTQDPRRSMPAARRGIEDRNYVTASNNRSGQYSPVSVGRHYRVRQGDTLYGIARRSGISVRRLMDHNGLYNPSNLRSGMILRIPR